MVNRELTGARDAERRAALSYAPAAARAGLEALLALDATLGSVLRTTKEPLVGQMRLTWWHEALAGLAAPPPVQPVLVALASGVVAKGVAPARLAALVEGWEALLDPLDPIAVARAAARGGALFALMATVIGEPDAPVAGLGTGWALADLSRHLSDPVLAAHARDGAIAALDGALARRWPRRLRGLSALALLARDDVDDRPSPPAGWRRIGRLARHGLTGR